MLNTFLLEAKKGIPFLLVYIFIMKYFFFIMKYFFLVCFFLEKKSFVVDL